MQSLCSSRRSLWRSSALALALLGCGCTFTVAGKSLAPIQPPAPAQPPDVEHTVGDFTFAIGGGDPTVSQFDGELLSAGIMETWKRRGYIHGEQFVEGGAFSPTSDYRLTLNGSLVGDTSFWLELLNALTITILPYTVTQHYQLHYVLENVKAGRSYEARVEASDKTWVEGLLILALPFANRGHEETVARMAEHLYDELHRQGAFEPARKTPPNETPGVLLDCGTGAAAR